MNTVNHHLTQLVKETNNQNIHDIGGRLHQHLIKIIRLPYSGGLSNIAMLTQELNLHVFYVPVSQDEFNLKARIWSASEKHAVVKGVRFQNVA
ncbi:TPA: hypothetical protein JAN03_16420 [Citrobacter freundii]|nr:hypothetical protein [Citrobacter freundii]